MSAHISARVAAFCDLRGEGASYVSSIVNSLICPYVHCFSFFSPLNLEKDGPMFFFVHIKTLTTSRKLKRRVENSATFSILNDSPRKLLTVGCSPCPVLETPITWILVESFPVVDSFDTKAKANVRKASIECQRHPWTVASTKRLNQRN